MIITFDFVCGFFIGVMITLLFFLIFMGKGTMYLIYNLNGELKMVNNDIKGNIETKKYVLMEIRKEIRNDI